MPLSVRCSRWDIQTSYNAIYKQHKTFRSLCESCWWNGSMLCGNNVAAQYLLSFFIGDWFIYTLRKSNCLSGETSPYVASYCIYACNKVYEEQCFFTSDLSVCHHLFMELQVCNRSTIVLLLSRLYIDNAWIIITIVSPWKICDILSLVESEFLSWTKVNEMFIFIHWSFIKSMSELIDIYIYMLYLGNLSRTGRVSRGKVIHPINNGV